MTIPYPYIPSGQTLLIDADDTLWENNIYFEQAIASFIEYLDHRELSPAEVREILNRIEYESILEHGYGIHSFRNSLLRCFGSFCSTPLSPEQEQRIAGFVKQIQDHPIHLMPGVSEVLPQLAVHHRLIVMTKGNFDEQLAKVNSSGIDHHFTAIEIHAEKTAATFRSVVEKHGLEPDKTWMIGNSPKSDINPALQAGLHAVFVPHPNTWVLEREELCAPPARQHCLHISSFMGLRELFAPACETSARMV